MHSKLQGRIFSEMRKKEKLMSTIYSDECSLCMHSNCREEFGRKMGKKFV
jgi:hypothetical protein